MKKLLVTVLAVSLLPAFAAWEKIGTLQTADMEGFSAAVNKLGEFCGNQIIGVMLSAKLTQLPLFKELGPTRSGTTIAYPIFIDSEKFGGGVDDIMDGIEYAILYPVSVSKEDFIKSHPGAIETNGAVRIVSLLSKKSDFDDGVDDSSDYDESEKDYDYVVFSDDGKWIGASDKIEQARLALKGISVNEKGITGDMIRFRLDAKGMKVLHRAAVKAAQIKDEEGNSPVDSRTIDMLSQVSAFVIGARISDKGVDIRGNVKGVAGSEFAKLGDSRLSFEPFKGMDKNAIIGSVTAADNGTGNVTVAEVWKEVEKILATNGLDIAKFLIAKIAGADVAFTLDPAALKKYAEANKEALEAIDMKKIKEDAESLSRKFDNGDKFVAKSPSQKISFAIAGYTPKYSLDQHFAATLPDVVAKKPSGAFVYSLTGLIQSLVPMFTSTISEQEKAALQPMIAALPAETQGAISGASWKENDILRFLFRISAQEFKAVSSTVNIFMAHMMMSAMNAAPAPKGECKGGSCTVAPAADDDDPDDDED